MIEVKGWKALGNKLVYDKIVEIKTLDPEIEEEEGEEEILEIANADIEENDEELEIENEETTESEDQELKLPDLPSDDQNKSNNATHEGEQLGLF
jgi:topoisomerase-4 subunit A